MGFLRRCGALPRLGIGVSTEFGAAAAPGSLDALRLAQERPEFAGFLEIGVEVEKGLDEPSRAWLGSGRPSTYHFLDVNLDEDTDQEEPWLARVRALLDTMRPAWLCGDAGLWHFGPRDRSHMLLLPPILVDQSATDVARGVAALRERLGREVFPENPPGTAYIGDLHLLEFFARVAERADTGILLDVAHLALYQRVCGHPPLYGLDSFPWERVVEVHVAGGAERETNGFRWVEDSHGTDVLSDTWLIFELVVQRSPNLKAVVFECERNANDGVIPGFERIARTLAARMDGWNS